MRPALAALVISSVLVGCSSSDAGVHAGTSNNRPTSSPSTESTPPPSTVLPTGSSPTPSLPEGPSGVGDELYPDLGNPGIDVDHYDIDLHYDPSTTTIDGTVTLSITATEDLSIFTLDSSGPDVFKVSIDGVAAEFQQHDPELVIVPNDPITNGERFDVAVAYTAQPSPGPGWMATSTGSFTQDEPDGARHWLPSNDHPSDKATYHFTLSVPAGLTAVANGTLVSHDPPSGSNAGDTWVWDQPEPMTTYLIQVLTGSFDIVDGVGPNGLPLISALQHKNAAAMQPYLELTARQIDFFDDLFGPYPFAEYGIAMTDGDVGGAIEQQGRSLFSAADFASGDVGFLQQALLSHELTHQWFGDSVSPARWQDIWLNESFATYGEWMWAEHAGFQSVDAVAQANLDQRHNGSDEATGTPDQQGLFGYDEYDGGAVVLHALRRTVGDATFFSILQAWSHDNYGKSRTSQDFADLASTISGQDLTKFFDDWLYATQVPDTYPS